MFPIRMMISIATACLVTLGASVAFSQQRAAGDSQREEHSDTKPLGDGMSHKGVVVHADPLNPQDPTKAEVAVDLTGVQPGYSNFCRVTATPEEVILDFGLNPQPFASGPQLVKVNQRIASNFYTAKRLMVALEATIRRHEQTFGPIELDVRRRTRAFQQQQLGVEIGK